MRASSPSLALAAAALLAGPAVAHAAAVQVSPTLVDLAPGARSVLVTLHNEGADAVRFEVRVRAWRQGPGGEMDLSPTSDVVAYPPVVEVGAGESRNLRVGVGAPSLFGPIEKSYRLVLQELRPPQKQGGAAQVQVLTQLNLPVFVAPTRAIQRASIEDLAADGGAVTFTVRNPGTVRIRAPSLKLTARGADGGVLADLDLAPLYLLAGGERAYAVEVPHDVCERVREVAVHGAMERGELRAGKATPEGVCAR